VSFFSHRVEYDTHKRALLQSALLAASIDDDSELSREDIYSLDQTNNTPLVVLRQSWHVRAFLLACLLAGFRPTHDSDKNFPRDLAANVRGKSSP
jgi:hypothetical protein